MSGGDCPFKVGDMVRFIHRSMKAGFPGQYGLPNVGEVVKVTAIVKDIYVQWEGMGSYPGGGLHWSDFDPVS